MTQGIFEITDSPLPLKKAISFIFNREKFSSFALHPEAEKKISRSYHHLLELIEKRVPIYGVTTGFGDSCFRVIPAAQSEQLQKNLIHYLTCGSGQNMPRNAVKATFLFRALSLSRGFSGISPELIQRIFLYLEKDWLPIVPLEGSLGASGDLIPLAYFAEILQGEGIIDCGDKKIPASQLLQENGIKPYTLKAKEGIALVNGTSTMCGMMAIQLNSIRSLLELQTLSSAWLCLALEGRTEAFDQVVNSKAKSHSGQTKIAEHIFSLLQDENYQSIPLDKIHIHENSTTQRFVQDRYSLRCSPQILGPILDTLSLTEKWLEDEINSVSDNPLIDENGKLHMGGNFYGGYLSQGLDYLKICLAHMADHIDRQLLSIVDEKSNRGLPPNLANWPGLSEEDRYLHHGLKGLHQSASAITSEVIQMSMPGGVLSRSSESHNQDKVSLGMSAASQCQAMIEKLFTLQTLHLICLTQALDLRKVQLQGLTSQKIYKLIRSHVPFIEKDQALNNDIQQLREALIRFSEEKGSFL